MMSGDGKRQQFPELLPPLNGDFRTGRRVIDTLAAFETIGERFTEFSKVVQETAYLGKLLCSKGSCIVSC
jgi:hypothetical protein